MIILTNLAVPLGLLVHELVTSAFKYIYFMASDFDPTRRQLN